MENGIESISSLTTPTERHGRATESSSARRRNPRWPLTSIQIADCASTTEQEAVVILRSGSLTPQRLASRGDGNDLLRVPSHSTPRETTSMAARRVRFGLVSVILTCGLVGGMAAGRIGDLPSP